MIVDNFGYRVDLRELELAPDRELKVRSGMSAEANYELKSKLSRLAALKGWAEPIVEPREMLGEQGRLL